MQDPVVVTQVGLKIGQVGDVKVHATFGLNECSNRKECIWVCSRSGGWEILKYSED